MVESPSTMPDGYQWNLAETENAIESPFRCSFQGTVDLVDSDIFFQFKNTVCKGGIGQRHANRKSVQAAL